MGFYLNKITSFITFISTYFSFYVTQ